MSPYRTLRRIQVIVALMMILSMLAGSPIAMAEATGSIAAFKFLDANQDGLWDSDEEAIEDWELCIGGVCQDTDANGFVTRGGLTQYTTDSVSETPPPRLGGNDGHEHRLPLVPRTQHVGRCGALVS